MTFPKKIKAMLQLIRPELPAAAGLCVVVGQVIALGEFPPLPTLGTGFLLGFLISSSAMIFNDYFDLEVDRINAPYRPLPSGLLSSAEVIVFGLSTALTGLIVALGIHPIVFVLSLITWVMGFLYNWKLKAAGLWGNLIVSSSVGMTFILGGVSVGQAGNPVLWVFSLIAFCFDLAEEIAGDAMDMAGDQKRSSRSIALLYGRTTALRISGLLFLLTIALTIFPVTWGETGLGYLIPIAIIDVFIALFTVRLLRSRTPQEGRFSMRVLYLSVSLGLLVFILSRFLK